MKHSAATANKKLAAWKTEFMDSGFGQWAAYTAGGTLLGVGSGVFGTLSNNVLTLTAQANIVITVAGTIGYIRVEHSADPTTRWSEFSVSLPAGNGEIKLTKLVVDIDDKVSIVSGTVTEPLQ